MVFRNLAPIVFAFMFLAVAEIGLEYRASKRGFMTLLFSKSTVSEKVDDQQKQVFGPTESFPFRSRILDENRESTYLKVWISSASHAEDNSLLPSLVFPSLLENKIRNQGAKVSVLNSSRAGISIASNTEDLLDLAPKFHPDVAILYQMSMNISLFSKMNPNETGRSVSIRDDETKKRFFRDYSSRLVENTTLYTLTKTNLSTRITEHRMLPENLPDWAYDLFSKHVSQYITTARELGITPVLCTFGVSSKSHDELLDEHWYALLRTTPNLSKKGWFNAIHEMNGRLESLAEEHHIPLIDIGSQLTGRTECFRDYVHFSAEGHQAVAEIIASTLIENELIFFDDLGSKAN